MKVPVVRGVIERRMLVNYRVAPDVLAKLLPPPFRPKLVQGWGMAGICLIRLKDIRPRRLPRSLGLSSENAAHRIAVEWDEGGEAREGVFILRRDTSSWVNAAVGGTLFPGEHHHAAFQISEGEGQYEVAMESDDGDTRVRVLAHAAPRWERASVFASLAEASEFFERGSLGYSPSRKKSRLDGLLLRCSDWRVEPLGVERVESSFFDDPSLFPPGSAAFDCALLMRDVHHEWHAARPASAASTVER